MDRRRFMVGAAGAGIAVVAHPWLEAGRAATDDDLAFAYFGISAEFLLAEYYSMAAAGRSLSGTHRPELLQGRAASRRHAKALSELLAGAGEAAPTAEDFAFAWPRNTFRERARTIASGLTILRSVQGTYQTAGATASEPSYRVLFTSLAASAGQQIGALRVVGGRSGTEPFPVALDLETASAAIEGYLG